MSHPRARHVTDLAAPPDGRLLFAPGPATAAYRWDGEVLCRLDARLSTAGAVPWDVPPGERLLAALPDLSRAVFGSGAGLRITGPGRTGRVVSVRHADSATFVARNRLLVSAPIMYLPDGRGREERGWHRVHLVDTEAARVVDRQLLGDSVDAGVDALAHPHDGTVLLTAFEGQDGGKVFAVRVDADRMTVRRIADDLIPVDFSPRGDRLLCIGYHGGPVVMLRWPDLTVVPPCTGSTPETRRRTTTRASPRTVASWPIGGRCSW
ncbi:hypothetical protein LX16_3763 [Stackebrandtia albiflava]|uniref:WD40 repeat protein n=1 Tax=Stackebrandtia albiflava TaxID=406432 RepID=A0A562V534_9ACTN|nr:hypothetical protein [Stackebrandtia albiflava]TWJ12996.1 hypothetical protein LX16_3763 [Stackebrandtia albiflava]